MSYKLRYAKLRGVARFAAAVVASGVAVAGLLSPATAAAQPAVGSSEATRQGAWDTRNSLNSQAGTLPPDAAQAVQGAVDGAVNGMFPGLIQEREAAIRAENERRAAAEAQSSAPLVVPTSTVDPAQPLLALALTLQVSAHGCRKTATLNTAQSPCLAVLKVGRPPAVPTR